MATRNTLPHRNRSYPQLAGIADWSTAESVKLLWDQIHELDDRIVAANTTITSQASTISTQATTIATLQTQIDRIAISTTKAAAASTGVDPLDVTDVGAVTGPFSQGPTNMTFPGIGTVSVWSSPDVTGWTETSTMTRWAFDPGVAHLNHTKLGVWSPVLVGPNTLQEATIWLFANPGSGWIGAGAERLRPSQSDKPEATNYSEWFTNLFYNDRWGPLSTLVPTEGMPAAMLITAGSTRVDNKYKVQERTNLIQFSWPADGASVTFL